MSDFDMNTVKRLHEMTGASMADCESALEQCNGDIPQAREALKKQGKVTASEIDAKTVMRLRELTGAPMMDCKQALKESGGDTEKAKDWLRKKGKQLADKASGREVKEGLVYAYQHHNGKLAVLVEIACETDFVAKNEDFLTFTREVSMQIAAMAPRYVHKDEVPADVIAREKSIRVEQAATSGKPAPVVEKMVDGQITKWIKEICLLDQPWVKDDKKTIAELQAELVGKLGENIKVRRFARFEVGEGLEKKSENFADEVAKQAGLS
jgi:elongation factor Ts